LFQVPDSRNYSLTVTRKGENLETEYSVVPSPAQATPDNILQAYKEKPINLETGANERRAAGIAVGKKIG
jgi:hypothetical protein